MTVLFNNAAGFAEDMTAGFVSAYRRYVRQVPDASGVIRADGPVPGRVGVVIGGGSGHYPAFCGLVGPGLATAAVIGNVFTSPSAEHAYRVARAADTGAGVVFSYGNYNGDVMNFGAAQQRLRAEGIDVTTVLVTDDLASAPKERAHERRGIAGDFAVFKAAGAAAERGDSLSEVTRLASKVNEHTRTLGVAFAGCTMPGRDEPLFTVDPTKMDIGLGIHGEPGIRTVERVSAGELATLLVEPLLEERPAGAGNRVAALLNGLGSTKYEELFVLWSSVSRALDAAGIEVIEPEVGELVTSLDMAGVSLTLHWLDEELEPLWLAGADTPGYRKGSVRRHAPTELLTRPSEPERCPAVQAGPGGPAAVNVLRRMLDAVSEHEEELGRLDAVAGDGDHGRGMVRGLTAALEAAVRSRDAGAGAGGVFSAAGKEFADTAGGASGVLWGALLSSVGAALGAASTIDAQSVHKGLSDGLAEVMLLGKAQPGDKTLLDALAPFVAALGERLDARLPEAWAAALPAAQRGTATTAEMTARRGRSAALADRSLGTPDPGATSLTYCLAAAADVLRGAE